MLATQKKNNLTADSLGLVKMERYTIEQRVFIIQQMDADFVDEIFMAQIYE